jgi:uncharacterized membrane protein YfcA
MLLSILYLRWLKMEERQALCTCVPVMCVLSTVSIVIYLWRGGGGLRASPYIAGGMAGGAAGAFLLKKIRPKL